jgi:3',5'-cyclic AMP phosphodiesterase CpdA
LPAHRAIHLSDLHRGKHESATIDAALGRLAEQIEPELVIASGDLANRGTREQLERGRRLLASLGTALLVVPGNHDIPYSLPGRFTHPWREFERVFGTAEPVVRTDAIVAVGLNSVRPWRQQGGRLRDSQLVHAAAALHDAPESALRVVVLHHHLAWAPWRGMHKFPVKRRDDVLDRLGTAGAELVCGGHIHQSTSVERREILALAEPTPRPLVLATAPGYGRPRPRRAGEAHGLHVYEWDAETLSVVTHIWDGESFTPTARRSFTRTTRL